MSLDKALEHAKKTQDELNAVSMDYSADALAITQELIEDIMVAIKQRDEILGEYERERARKQGVG